MRGCRFRSPTEERVPDPVGSGWRLAHPPLPDHEGWEHAEERPCERSRRNRHVRKINDAATTVRTYAQVRRACQMKESRRGRALRSTGTARQPAWRSPRRGRGSRCARCIALHWPRTGRSALRRPRGIRPAWNPRFWTPLPPPSRRAARTGARSAAERLRWRCETGPERSGACQRGAGSRRGVASRRLSAYGDASTILGD